MAGTPKPRPVTICACGDHAFCSLSRGYVTMVSPEDAYLMCQGAYSAQVTKSYIYAVRNTKPKGKRLRLSLHRQIMAGAEIDHRNGNTLDNRRSNLRPATARLNQGNQRVCRGAVPYRGVSKQRGIYRAKIRTPEGRVDLGQFETPELAARAYDAAALRTFGEFACTNAALGLYGNAR